MSTSATVELKSCPLYVNGKPVISRGPKDIQYNPATGEAIAEIPRTTPEEISAAVEAANKAFASWSKTPVIQRVKVLFKYRELLEVTALQWSLLILAPNNNTVAEA